MDFTTKLRNTINKFLGGNPRQSLGFVQRNRVSPTGFNPEQQLTGITYKAIDKIGQTLSVYDPMVSKANGEPYVNHPLYQVMREPNPRQELGDFVWLYGMLMEIYGETFWYLARGENTNKVKEVWLLDPSKVEIKISDGEVIGYILHKGAADYIPLEPDEVYHDRRPNPFNEWRGMSILEKASVYVDTEIQTSDFTLNYIKNNASPSGIVSTPDMSREAFKLFTTQWREGYEGPKNAGKTAFIRGGEAKFQAVGATLKDIELEKVRNMSKDDVLMMLDMPKAMLGMVDEKGFNRASVETLKLIYAENKLEPMMNRLDQIWERIGANYAREGKINITHESPIPEDREFMHKIHKDLVNVAITVNEVRKELDLDPIPGGDELKEDNTVPQVQRKLKVVKKKEPSKAELRRKQHDEREAFRKELEENVDVYSKKVQSEISTFAARQGAKVITAINATSKAFEEWLFNIKEESEELALALTPLLLELMEEEAANVSNFITGELLTISPEMREEVAQDILRIAGLYNEESYKALEKTLAQGQQQGESLAKLKKRVEDVYSDAKGYRAERIARTESARAANSAAEEVYKQNGYNKVEWFINPGACEFCRTYAGRTREIGGVYNKVGDVVNGDDGGQLRIDYREIQVPPLHPNCTCSLVPVE